MGMWECNFLNYYLCLSCQFRQLEVTLRGVFEQN